MNKIKEKLTGSSSEEQNRLQKAPPESGNTSGHSTTSNTANASSGFTSVGTTSGNTSGGSQYVQNPISSTGGRPTGTAVDNYGSTQNTSATSGSTPGMISRPEGYPTQINDPSTQPTTTNTGYGATSSGYTPRSPYDPYSARGQQTAAAHATGPPGSTDYTQSSALNQAGDPRYSTTTSTGNSQLPQSISGAQYGRDAGMVGGAGATGIGGYETGQHSGTSTLPYDNRGMTSQAPIGQTTQTTTSNPSNVSYINRDTIGGQQDPNSRPFVNESAGIGGAGAMGANPVGSSAGGQSAGQPQSAELGKAYEAGYRDAMAHMKADIEKAQMK